MTNEAKTKPTKGLKGPSGAGSQAAPFLGVPTSTPVAFTYAGKVYLERMNLLSLQGCGVLAELVPTVGSIVDILFKPSTVKGEVRAKAEVIADIPTTPTGLEIRKQKGDRALPAITSAGMSDSATAIFRISDLKPPAPAPSGPSKAPNVPAKVEPAKGFCLNFLEIFGDGADLVEEHIRNSKLLSVRLAAEGQSATDARLVTARQFGDGDLSKRALDW